MINLKAEKADGDELKELTGVNPLDGAGGDDGRKGRSLRDDEEELLKNKRDGPLSPEEQFEADEEAKKRKLAPFADTGFDALRKMFEDDAQKRADKALKDSMRGDVLEPFRNSPFWFYNPIISFIFKSFAFAKNST